MVSGRRGTAVVPGAVGGIPWGRWSWLRCDWSREDSGLPGRLGRSSAGWQRAVRGNGQGIANKLMSFSANEGVSLTKEGNPLGSGYRVITRGQRRY